ncbi:hypothetical protein [Erythrobacter sp. YT30]|uniref:hypothetical protein n=1 Tax=Erythrobacter sp. YT30 TaxID=1735012 RepID=UPI00076C5C20|nr:hypothetical protein [Erythrobacter sp. YT30]KWV91072.1 hypothetical protein AUC45_07070 [Erythrobacter sp. YT30]
MSSTNISDADLSRVLKSGVDPQVPDNLASRITMSVIAEETGQDLRECEIKEEVSPTRSGSFRFAALAACAAAVVAVSTLVQFGGQGEATARLAVQDEAAQVDLLATSAPDRDTSMPEEQSSLPSTQPSNPPVFARLGPDAPSKKEADKPAKPAAQREIAQPSDPVAPNEADRPIEDMGEQLAANEVAPSQYVLNTDDGPTEVYGPVEEPSRNGFGIDMNVNPVIGKGFAGGPTPPPSSE